KERNRIDIRRKRDRIQWDAAGRQLAREVPRTRLVLVQHQETDVPTALLQPGQKREQVRLRPGDTGDLLQMKNTHAAAALRIPSAHVSTEWCRATRSRRALPISPRSASPDDANQRKRSARLSGDSRSNRSG